MNKKNPVFKTYNFSNCREITEEELYLINGGAQIENTNEAVAGAQPGDTLIRDDGTEVTITQGDIDWANDHLGTGGDNPSQTTPAVSEPTPESQPSTPTNSSSTTGSTSSANTSTPSSSYGSSGNNTSVNSGTSVPAFTDPFAPESNGNFEIDNKNKTVSADINKTQSVIDAYNAYYILSDRDYQFQLKDGNDVVHTFTDEESVKKYILTKTSTYNEGTGYSKREIKNFKEMSAKEQLTFLKKEINSVELGTKEAGIKANYIRTQLKSSMKLKGLFYSSDGDEVFMNEELRSFLNLNKNGKNEYSKSDMKEYGWMKMIPYFGDNEHQHNQNGGRNIKYVNIDGREAIFDAQGNYISDGIDGATFNYGTTGNLNLISTTLGSSHGQYDMKPFYRQNAIDGKWWSMQVGSNYGFNSN